MKCTSIMPCTSKLNLFSRSSRNQRYYDKTPMHKLHRFPLPSHKCTVRRHFVKLGAAKNLEKHQSVWNGGALLDRQNKPAGPALESLVGP